MIHRSTTVSGLEYLKRMLQNMCFCLDNIDTRLSKIEGFFLSDFASKDLTDPPAGDSALTSTVPFAVH